MAGRYDHVEPHVGIVRAPLAANLTFDANGGNVLTLYNPEKAVLVCTPR